MAHTSGRLVLTALLGAMMGACGGGGGGGGESPIGGPTPAGAVVFEGFGFRIAGGPETSVPPLEDAGAKPPSLGAPLDVAVLFHFDGVPSQPIGPGSLPVFTTPAQMPVSAKPPAGSNHVPARGDYVLVTHANGHATVEFRPFIPTAPLQADLTAPPQAVPGLLPGSVYTASVTSAPSAAIGNLSGGGGSISFGTTSNPAAYYPKGVGAIEPPALLASLPPPFASDFQPSTFGGDNPAVPVAAFPEGPRDFLLTFDRPIEPTAANVFGEDLDGDGVVDPVFFLSTRATRLLVGLEVPAGALGSATGFAALAAVADGPGVVPAPDGSDLVLADGAPAGLGAGEASFVGPIASLASGRDAGLLFAVLDVDGGSDHLTVFDHLLGDPSRASQAVDEFDQPTSLDTGLDELVGLTTLLDGRLVAYDRGTRRIHELMPEVGRRPGTVSAPQPGPPRLLSLAVGDGVNGFRSEPLLPAGVAGVLDVRDLAMSPEGHLYALAVIDVGGSPALLRLAGIDPDGDGQFDPDDGLFSGEADDVLLEFAADYVDVVFDSAHRLLALDAGADRVDAFDPVLGQLGTVLWNVGAYGVPSADHPARAITVGTMQLGLSVSLDANDESGSVVRLAPEGLLPFGAELHLMQRHTFTSLAGVNDWNADPLDPEPPLGGRELLTVTTALPLALDPSPFIDDVFLEDFVDDAFEGTAAGGESPPAEWADLTQLGQATGGLRASVGVGELGVLGDFRPLPDPLFNPGLAYDRSNFTQLTAFLEPRLDLTKAGYRVVLLDTDAQHFPLPDGSTPGVSAPTTVFGGRFAFHDFVVPEGVHVVVRGSNPLRITATGRVEIHGLIDLSGTDGFSDDTFDSGFLPVPGGAGGAGGGRGGDGHPTLFDPKGPGTIDQYVTPERGERGWGPRLDAAGQVSMVRNGGWGGLSTMGYDPNPGGYPKLLNSDNDENHRPPGGGGGSFFTVGQPSRQGSGVYLVESSSTWFPFPHCPGDDKITMARYGNDENRIALQQPSTPLQCVYMVGTPSAPQRLKPGAPPGDAVFTDADADNDWIGPGAELPVLIGGQGGGGGGSRIDSMRHPLWSANVFGAPDSPFIAPHYPKLVLGVAVSPTLYDAKPGAGGGGGGSFLLRSFGDILMGRTARIEARGGHGGGGEVVKNSAFAAGGGGGSGGAVLLQAAGSIVIQADAGHRAAGYRDKDGDVGASIDVSGGFGRDARSAPGDIASLQAPLYEFTRSDGGQGGFGLIQLQTGDGTGLPQIEQGAHLYARQRSIIKLGVWTGDSVFDQSEHLAFSGATGLSNDLRYIDMLHYRYFRPDANAGNQYKDRYMVLNGSSPPIIPSVDGDNGHVAINEWPEDSGQFWFDTAMIESPLSQGRRVVRDPEPEKIMKTYNGWNITFLEINNPPTDPDFPNTPGTTWRDEQIPFCVQLEEPDGTPKMIEVDGQQVFDPTTLVDRLPVVHPSHTPPPLGTVSKGRSDWMDFAGATLRSRDVFGRTPPFFQPVHGTYNAGVGPEPSGKQGQVVLGGNVPGAPARYVANAGFADPGLLSDPPAGVANPPYNDIKVDAPDAGIGLANALTDNATVVLQFQGARPVRPGSRVPDLDTLTPWVADLTALDGYALVRFQVVFDLDAKPLAFPFGPASWRPQVDWVRVRARY